MEWVIILRTRKHEFIDAICPKGTIVPIHAKSFLRRGAVWVKHEGVRYMMLSGDWAPLEAIKDSDYETVS